MGLKKMVFVILIFFILPSLAFAGKAYYIDCSASKDGDGSYSSPWNNFSSVNDYYWRDKFNTGDDVYLKAGTTCRTDVQLDVNWDGTASDKVIVGVYSGEGRFTLNGKPRPIIDGQNRAPGDWKGLINKVRGSGHVIVENLKVQNSTGHAIQFSGPDNVTVRNCHTYRTHRTGITFAYVNTGLIENNTVEWGSWGMNIGASLQVTAGFKEGTAKNVTVRGNTVSNGYEGIGIYKAASYNLVENNVVYDNRSYQIYSCSGTHHNVIRNNTVYTSESDPNPPRAIVLNCEAPDCSKISLCADYHDVYNNKVEGDIVVVSNCPDYSARANDVFDNRSIDGNITPSTPSTCSLASRFQETTLTSGNRYYTDRDYKLTSVPSEYAGMDFIRTPNDERSQTMANSYLTFELNSATTVYVAYDSRATSLPSWMSGFSNTGDRIYTSLGSQPYLKVYSKWYSAGTCVNLGANKASGFSGSTVSNYIVFYGTGGSETPNCTLDAKFKETTLNDGIEYYTDRDYKLTSVPPVYMGLDLIKTPNDDRGLKAASDYMNFELSGGMTVYVAYDSRATSLPSWMSGFTNTGDRIYTSLKTQPYLKVYSRWFSAGTCVNLGANKASGFSGSTVSNYIVFY